MSEEKIFVGNGKEKFNGDKISVTIDLESLREVVKPHAFEYNGRRYIRLNVQKRRQPDEYGRSHYVAVDTWQPDSQQTATKAAQPRAFDAPSRPNDIEDDIPF